MPEYLICLDPGHVFKYNRGSYAPYYEGSEMYNFALILKEELELYNGLKACLTRTSVNHNPSLAERANYAKKQGASVFISLHTNGADMEYVNYVMIYGSVAMAAKSDPLAIKLAAGITELYNKNISSSIKNNGVSHQKLANGSDYMGVLRNVTGGSIQYSMLLEHGFHSNYNTCAWLYKKENQRKLAKTEAAIIAAHFGCKLKETPPPVVEPIPVPPSNNNVKSYKVARGDSWWSIAAKEMGNGAKYKELAAYNGLSSDSTIYAGQVLKIPSSNKVVYSNYIVKKGDSLSGIAKSLYNNASRYVEIAKANGITDANNIFVGMVLRVPSI